MHSNSFKSFHFLTKIPTHSLQTKEVESQRRRGEEMDAMLTERDRKLAEKEAYIVHLQTALAGDTPAPPQVGGGNIYLRTAETTRSLNPFTVFAGNGGGRRAAGAAAAGAESEQEGGGVGGALQSAAGAGGEPEGAAAL